MAVLSLNAETPTHSTFLAAGQSEVEHNFLNYLAKYGKNYATKEELAYRFEIFSTNYHRVMQHNMQNEETHSLGINQFADLSPAEYKKILGYKPALKTSSNYKSIESNGKNPASVDWRGKAVTPVKNQGSCGSCWAFSTTGSVEGLYAISHGEIKSFSEQQLVDCSKSGPDGNQGCNGGLMDLAFTYLETNEIETEADYPYKGQDNTCTQEAAKGAFGLKGFVDVPVNSAQALEDAVALGPVSVAIEADTFTFQLYNGGIISSTACGVALDHGVLVVGYGSEANQDYWILKNSWGPSWGEKGFFRIAKGADGPGICGLQQQASYPTA